MKVNFSEAVAEFVENNINIESEFSKFDLVILLGRYEKIERDITKTLRKFEHCGLIVSVGEIRSYSGWPVKIYKRIKGKSMVKRTEKMKSLKEIEDEMNSCGIRLHNALNRWRVSK